MKTTKLSPRQALVLAVSILAMALLACNLNPVMKISPSIPTAEVIFSAPEAVIALATDKEENVYATTIEGDVLKIAPDGKSEQIYSGLERCGFSDRTLAVLPNGDVIVNHCVEKKDTLIKIDQEGNKTTLVQLEGSLTSMTSDSSGKLYLGFWTSQGNISINFQPITYLGGADDMSGHVSVLGQDGQLESLYEGGIPLSLAASEAGELYAAIWGQAGRFKPQSKEYSMCGPTKNFWIGLSNQVEIQQLAPEQKVPIVKSEVSGIFSHIAGGKEGLFAFGKLGGGECGIYQIKQGGSPQRLSLTEDDADKNVTDLAVSDDNLYFSDVDGNVYRVGLKNLVGASEAAEPSVVALLSPTTAATQPPPAPPTATPVSPTSTPAPTLASIQPTSVPMATTQIPEAGELGAPSLPAGNWQPVLDLPRQINTLVVDPTNPQVLYAGTGDYASSGSGVYKSEDAGLTWQSVSAGLPYKEVLGLAFSPGELPTLYALVGSEVFASTDGAQSWTRLGDIGLVGGGGRLLQSDPRNGNVLYAIVQGDEMLRSNDGGHTWLPVGEGLPSNEHGGLVAFSLAIDPTDVNVVYLGTGAFVGGGHGVYKSTDGSETWSPANRGMLDYRITALAIDPANPQTVYAGSDSGELFKSADGGQTWDDLTDKLPVQGYLRPGMIQHIIIDPTAPETVYLLSDNVGILFSTDEGASWRPLGKPGERDQPTFTAMTVIFGPKPVFVVGMEREGGWRYAEGQPAPTPTATMPAPTGMGGKTPPPVGSWQPIPDLPREVSTLVVDPTNPNVFYAGSASGVYKSEDTGLTWQPASTGLPSEEVLALALSPDVPTTLYAAVRSAVFASTDGARSWTRLGDSSFISGFYRHLYHALSDTSLLFMVIEPGGLIRSNDGGHTWLPIGEGLPGGEHEVYVMSLAIDPTDPDVVYAGTGAWVGGGHGVYKSVDGGETWSSANRRMLDYRITALAIDPMHPQTVYAGGDYGELFKSTDGGQTWDDLTGGLQVQRYSEPRTIRGIVLDPTAPETIYLLGDNSGVLFSSDGGAKWRPLGKPGEHDQPTFTAWAVAFTPQPIMVVGIENGGVWRYASP